MNHRKRQKTDAAQKNDDEQRGALIGRCGGDERNRARRRMRDPQHRHQHDRHADCNRGAHPQYQGKQVLRPHRSASPARYPAKIFIGCASGLAGWPNNRTAVAPSGAISIGKPVSEARTPTSADADDRAGSGLDVREQEAARLMPGGKGSNVAAHYGIRTKAAS